jgi:methylglutaconyl-CoA hydratase
MARRDPAYRKIKVEPRGRAAVVSFARPEVRNAFDVDLLGELRVAMKDLARRNDSRVLVLTGAGTSFCAGADIAWMKKSAALSEEENLREARELASCLYELYSHPLPTIALVNGPAIGGGVGFVVACDIAVSEADAFFAFSEVRIGVTPACIGPYVVKKVGEPVTRELFLTGEKIGAERAREIGLVSRIAAPDHIWEVVDEYVGMISRGAPGALASSKELIEKVSGGSLEEVSDYTARLIARLRVAPEGQEGMRAFFEKRKPKWQS